MVVTRRAPNLPSRGASESVLTKLKEPRRVVLALSVAILLFLVVVPVAFLLYGSVVSVAPGQEGQLSFGKYVEVLTEGRTYRILGNSVIYAVGSTLVSFVLGTVLVWFVQRTDIPGKAGLGFLALFPIFMPVVLEVVGWKLLLDPDSGVINSLLVSWGLSWLVLDINTLYGMILVAGLIHMPLVYLWMWPALRAMDPSLEEAAAMSRSRPLRVLRTVTFPVLLPALGATFLINLVLAMEDIIIPAVIGLPAGISVLSTEIFLAYTNVPVDVQAASVYGVLLLGITVALMLFYRRLTSQEQRYAVVRGRGYRPTVTKLGRARWPFAGALYLVMGLVVGLPVLVLVWTSLSPYLRAPSVDGFRDLTLTWYQALTTDALAIRGLVNTTILGIVAAVCVMLLALVIGWLVIHGKGKGITLLDLLAFSPIAIPGLVLGLSLLWLYASLPLPIYGTLVVLGIAFVTRFIPYGVRLTYSALKQLHKELEEAAYVAGSGWGKTLRTITLPLLTPTLVVTGIYTMLRVFQEVGASLLLATYGTEPYSVVAYNLWEAGETGKTAAYGVVAIVIVSVMVIFAERITRRHGVG